MKTFASVAGALALAALVVAPTAQAQDKGTVGVSMPTKSSARWIADGDNMVKVLQAKGYKVDLQYADNDIPEPARPDREHDHQEGKSPGDRGHRWHHAFRRTAEGGGRRN